MTLVCLPRPVLRLQVLLCLAPPRLAWSCRVLSCCVLSLFCGVWSCPVLPWLASLCLVCFLPCLVLSYFWFRSISKLRLACAAKVYVTIAFLKELLKLIFVKA